MSKEIEIKNFDTPVGLSIEQQIAQAVAKAEARIKSQNLKGKTNSIQLGCTVRDLEVRQGSEMRDKKTNELIVDNRTGETMRFADKYYVTLSFNGGSLTQEVRGHIYGDLQINNDYFCIGYLGEVNDFGKVKISPIFTEFQNLSV